MSISAIGSGQCSTCSDQVERVRQFQGGPAKRLDALIERFLNKTDADANGTLGNDEVSALSADDFAALDSDNDGQLNSGEIKAAAQKLRDAFESAIQNGDSPRTAFESLKDTPEGKLVGLLRPGRRQGPPPVTPINNSLSVSPGYTVNATSISISITGTNLNLTA